MPKHHCHAAVLSKNGMRLMPTSAAHARRLLKSGRAVIECYRPFFTIRLTGRTAGAVQLMELKCDTGYAHIGLSVCTGTHEIIRRQYDLLKDEPERHRNRQKYRRTRRNRKRYRAPRFSNRRGMICRDGFPPSIRNRRDRHIDLITAACQAFPVTDAYIEMGQFDTQVLKAIAEGKPLPEGTDYQQGEQHGFATLREAIFTRDRYTCRVCGRSVKDGAILHVHHIGFWKQDRTDRPGNLMTVCEKCHTPKNHQPGGKLYGLAPKLPPLKEATFMTSVRRDLWKRLKAALPDGLTLHMTYGVDTKQARRMLHLPKSHTNDAYAMGTMHPRHRTAEEVYRKRRRNNRVLEKFYDARYIDIRDGQKKKASALGCNRTKRNIPRNNENNERMYRGPKISGGQRRIRRKRHPVQAGDIVSARGYTCTCRGMMSGGKSVWLYSKADSPTEKAVTASVDKTTVIRHADGWNSVSQD